MKPIVNVEKAQWDAFVRGHERGHVLQLSAWGDLKAHYGWYPVRVALVDARGEITSGAQILFRRLPLMLGTIAYLPFAPLTNWEDETQLQATMAAIDNTARQHRAILLKVEAGHGIPPQVLQTIGLEATTDTTQPPRTILIDLDGEEAVLGRMNQMTRRNIRKSDKMEVIIRQGTREDVASFNALLDETGRRQGFGVHRADYYEHTYDLFVSSGDAALFLGSYAGQDLAGVFVFKVGKWAWYLYGASRQVERQRMAAFGVQWAAIQWAMAAGCTVYDLYGIPDVDEATLEAEFETRQDDLWGVYRFKRGWGGRVAQTVGAWQKVYHLPLYWVYQRYLQWRRKGFSG